MQLSKTLTIIFLSIISSVMLAQNKWHLNISNTPKDDISTLDNISNFLNITGDVSYNLYEYLELGVYLGISSEETWFIDDNYSGQNYIVPSYGTFINLQILPLIKKKNSWIDTYISGRVGAYHKTPNYSTERNNKMHAMYKLSPGIRFFPWRKMGIFYEYAIIKNNDISTPHTYGLTWRF